MEVARKILFSIFVLVYAVLCPFIILYSFGYIYQPEKKDISQTGLIYLSSFPSGASVYLEKSRFKNKTPATISELKPGQYQLGLRLKSYRPWSHQVTIEPGKASVFKNVPLLPVKFNEITLLPGGRYTSLAMVRGTDYFVVQEGSRLKEFYIYDRREKEIKPLVGAKAEYSDFAVNSIFTENKSELLIVYGGPLWNKKYLLFNLADINTPPSDITGLFKAYPYALRWSADSTKDVFAVYEGFINRFDIKNYSIYPKYFDGIKGFGLSNRWLYLLGADNVIIKSTPDKKQEIILFEDEHLGRDLFKWSRFYEIKEIYRDALVFWGDRGDLIVSLPPYRIFDKNVSGMEYNESKNRVVFWTKNNIWVADFNMLNTEYALFNDRLQISSAYRQGSSISQCLWAYNGAHILFKDKNDVYLLALNSDGRHHKEHIVSVKDNTDVFYAEDENSLYYLDQGANLTKIQLFPKEKAVPLAEESQ
ncbi:MAG: hypothetical protein COV72_01880 [Candidatus Omnitrophica bacterium CG11_big_fil_rev_8_21_14_0_20_42_13]|uniref:PEGA domain-containing protein n=1 Tax=Candidatus Ghiorseimicrobium undicola TaxID=1974746 RepID=A0A2H0LZ71_9BACT|nr:MAG: hypothetical protein COV72_01880 [Candidatus Omnitrophica bacterium CG11_big_fil_rev_8_21_14_0_20_42_13]